MVGPGTVPDPALVVLVGASGAGKSAWAAAHFRAAEIVSSDDLRGVVGSGRHDLDASADAFALLDLVVAGRTRRGLTTVVDTLGLEPERRRGYLALARAHGLPAVVVAFDTPPAVCRRRNAARDRPVPARVLAVQLAAYRTVADRLEGEGWDVVVTRSDTEREPEPVPEPVPAGPAPRRDGLEVVLQLSRFPWGDEPGRWLREIALAADEAGFAGARVDGPPDPDPPGGGRLGADPGAVGHPRPARGPRHRAPSRHPGQPGDPAAAGRARQDGRHPRRALRRPGVLRCRGRLVGA